MKASPYLLILLLLASTKGAKATPPSNEPSFSEWPLWLPEALTPPKALISAEKSTCESKASVVEKFIHGLAQKKFRERLKNPESLFRIFNQKTGPLIHSFVLDYMDKDPEQMVFVALYRRVLHFLEEERYFVGWLSHYLSSTAMVERSSSHEGEINVNGGVTSPEFNYGQSWSDRTYAASFRLFTSAHRPEDMTLAHEFTIIHLSATYQENGNAVGRYYDIHNGSGFYLVVRGDKLEAAFEQIKSSKNPEELQKKLNTLITDKLIEAALYWYNPYRVGSAHMRYLDQRTVTWSEKPIEHNYPRGGRHYIAARFMTVLQDLFTNTHTLKPSDPEF